MKSRMIVLILLLLTYTVLGAQNISFPVDSVTYSPNIKLTNEPAWNTFLNKTNIYNVKTYNAKADGATDDTTAIQNTINLVSSVGGGTVVFPKGIYNITSPIRVTNQITLSGYQSNSVIRYVGTTNIIAVVVFGDEQQTLGSGNGYQHLGANDLTIVGNQYCTNGILFHFVTHSSFKNLTVRDALNCFRIRWGVSCTYINLLASGNEGAWGYVPDTGLRIDSSSFNLTFINPVLEAGTTNGIVLDGAGGNIFIGGTSEWNTNGVIITNHSQQNVFVGLDCEGNHYSDFIIDSTSDYNRIIGCQASQFTQISGFHNSVSDSLHDNILITAQATNTHITSVSYNNYTNNGVSTLSVGLVDLFQNTDNFSKFNQLSLSHNTDYTQVEQPLLILDPNNSNRRMYFGYDTTSGYGYIGVTHIGTANQNIIIPGGNMGIGTTNAINRLTVNGDISGNAITATNVIIGYSNLLVGPNPTTARLSVSDTNNADPGSMDFIGSVLSLRKNDLTSANYPRLDFWLNGVRGGYLGYGNINSHVIQFVCENDNDFNLIGDLINFGMISTTNVFIYGQGYVYHPGNLPATNNVTGLTTWMNNVISLINGKEPTISTGSANQYWKYNKTWGQVDWTELASRPSNTINYILKGNGDYGWQNSTMHYTGGDLYPDCNMYFTGGNSIILQNGGGITIYNGGGLTLDGGAIQSGAITASGIIQSTSGYKSADGSSGVTQDIVVGAQTIRVKNGIITAVF